MIHLLHKPLLLLMPNHYVKTLCLVAFLVYLLIHICAFCILDHICLWWLVSFYELIFFLYAFPLTITYQYHLLLLLCRCCRSFFANINHFIHTLKKNIFDLVKCLIIFNQSHVYKLVIFLEFTLFSPNFLVFNWRFSHFPSSSHIFVSP